jgi:hypothetical protein
VPVPYELRVNITPERSRDLIVRLIEDADFRQRVEADPRAILSEYGIEITPEALPEPVRLPEPEAIREFLSLLETRIAPEREAPYDVCLIVCMFGAMPVLEGNRPALDGTG